MYVLQFLVLAGAAFLTVRVILAKQPTWHINVVIITVIVGSVMSIAFRRELWPFSHYPMFASVQRDELVRIRLYGVPEDNKNSEFEMLGKYTAPLSEIDLVYALRKISRREGEGEVLERAVRDCLSRYEQRRQNGLHDGPTLAGVRLYEVRWKLDSTVANRDEPSKKTLLLEVIPKQNRRSKS